MSLPRLSILTNVKNGGATIARCLASVRALDYPDVEHVVQDGGSTDGTVAVLQAYAAERPASVRLVSEPDTCPEEGFYRGLRRCRGELIASCMADEALLPAAGRWAAAAFAAHPAAGAVYGATLVTDVHGTVLHEAHPPDARDFLRRYVCHELVPPLAATVFRRTALEAVGLHTRAWARAVGEFELWVRVGAAFPVVHVPGLVTRYAVHETSGTQRDLATARLVAGRLALMAALFDDPATLAPLADLRERANAGLHIWLLESTLNAGLFAAAAGHVRQALRHAPDWSRLGGMLETALNRGVGALRAGRLEEGLALLEVVHASGLDVPQLHPLRALALRALGRMEEAREAATTALALHPDAATATPVLREIAAALRRD